MRRIFNWIPLVLGIVLLSIFAALEWHRISHGVNDFMGLYVGGKLVGNRDLYSRPANEAMIRSILGSALDNVTYIRPPFYATLLKPLAVLPYRVAYGVFSLAAISSVLWFVIRFSNECPALPFFTSISIPVLAALWGGQDTPFLLVLVGGSMVLTRRSKDFSAGLVLSLCAIKFHLFLFLPVLLLVKKRWGILRGAACGTLILTGLGVFVAGADSMQQYAKVLRDPWISPGTTVMPNLHGLVTTLHGDVRLEAALVAVVLAAFLWIMQKTDRYEFLLAASLVCGLLVSFHSYVSDCVILLPAFVSVIRNSGNVSLRSAAALILTPIPYFMLLAESPYSAAFPVSLLLILGLFCTAAQASETPPASSPDLATPQLKRHTLMDRGTRVMQIRTSD